MAHMFWDDPDTAGQEDHGQKTTKKAEPPDIDGHEETPEDQSQSDVNPTCRIFHNQGPENHLR